MSTVLVVDDEPQIIRALRIYLGARGYDVVTAATGQDALLAAKRSLPDLIVLDLGLPDLDGVEVIARLRTWTETPIVILSGRSQSQSKIQALEAGADDYVTKPFNVDELLARIRAVTRRTQTANEASPTPVVVGDVTVDLAMQSAKRGTEDVHLTKTEWKLLRMLLSNPGALITQQQLIREIRGPEYDDVAHYLRQYMAQLRGKLEPNPSRPKHLLTEPGMGYRFQE